MKTPTRKFILLTVVILISALQIDAQIIIDKNDMPSPGDIIITSTGLNLDFINYQETGENYFWDFSELSHISQNIDTLIDLEDVNFVYWWAFNSSANLVKKENVIIPIPDFPISDAVTFLNSTNNNYSIAGEGASLYGFPVPLKFNLPDILYRFPMEYGNTGNSFADYELGLPSFGFIRKEVSRENTVDGWGTLTTPYGTYEVLRIKSEVAEFDSLYIDSLGMGIPIYRDYTEYSWLGKDQNAPLLIVTTNLGGIVVNYLDSLRQPPSAINENFLFIGDEIEIFPNPTHDILNVSLELFSRSDIEIKLYNSSGIEAYEFNSLGNNTGAINIILDLRQAGLKNGIYFMRTMSGNQHITKKIILY